MMKVKMMIDIIIDMTFHIYVSDFDISVDIYEKSYIIILIKRLCTFDFISGGWLQVFCQYAHLNNLDTFYTFYVLLCKILFNFVLYFAKIKADYVVKTNLKTKEIK